MCRVRVVTASVLWSVAEWLRVVSHSCVLITLKEDMHGDIGQKEVR